MRADGNHAAACTCDRNSRCLSGVHQLALWTAGSIEGLVVLIVVHTTYPDEHGEEVIRIILARKATPRERRWYEHAE